jgi:hypothetical protein
MAQGKRATHEIEATETQDLWRKYAGLVMAISVLDRVVSLDRQLPAPQKLLTPAARAGLSAWSIENQDFIEMANFEATMGAAQIVGSLMKQAPPAGTVEQFEACYEAALTSIAEASE